jgi:hypothetical protein
VTDLEFLDGFADTYTPQTSSQLPLLDYIPDGEHECTVLTAAITETKNAGKRIIRMEVRFDALGKTADKVYFIDNPENVNRFGGDMATLGFAAASWGKEVPLSKAIPETVAALRGKRFKATKRANKSGDKVYHNLYLNAALPDATDLGPATTTDPQDVPF